MTKYISVLTIAGSDSGGGAGIQADLKTFSALGCFGTSAITAITVQNTLGVSGIHSIPPDIVAGQIRAVMDDIQPSAIKIGMIHSPELALAIAETLKSYPDLPVVLDPVMVATSGDRLIESETIAILKEQLFPLVSLVTPNLDEAAILANIPLHNLSDMHKAADIILQTGCNAVLVKGGHLAGRELFDVYKDQQNNVQIISSQYIDTENTHGTGCTLSAAIAAYLARGEKLGTAIDKASQYIHTAIAAGQHVQTGKGHGPLNHFFAPEKLITHEME
ncbi:bifunctional hydroxymethylpyrimidine kinase/phosphomethylpyrimidine kinase [Chitinophaga sancti]|uniref:hydroxymethylpyrimidine kinase n=1 Tax=Chitinophaga sancti TaxID=1004 RepID=A0A1K1RAN7_9BACT|nr:bifunctional hydroxymethylpyrimidine kinase/phosphomethylpyrimidine kinase [Chitinophaga sancti]WQD65568.1 bifunctional hydroxymethylpyrimidine kinase/phosphomethylpyrimidine kinase [Chitinophaga sancti]WQG88809.1 bifunctional hydroxymethylpyrimidine kinase/phosphomethylpyrimidine kinase [Chitinophaga sancti]SFW69306.1 hydroxymethylpyrimidine/phosphomethylpyrimidine kinase [Chitinophaga sancti]